MPLPPIDKGEDFAVSLLLIEFEYLESELAGERQIVAHHSSRPSPRWLGAGLEVD